MSGSKADPGGPGGPSLALIRAFRRLLRPLVRLMLAHQVTYTYLTGLLKEIFVEVAERDFPLEGKARTDSRVSLLTGIHRKDVKRLRGRAPESSKAPASLSLGSQVVARWTNRAEYLDAEGQPRPLPRQANDGGGPSFDELVASVSRDIRPRAVLDEWLRLGVVRLDDADRVVLDRAGFIPSRGFDEKAFYFGRNLQDHIAAGAHNLMGGNPPFVDRSVYYDGLSSESVLELKRLSEAKGMEALQAVNRRAMELQERDRESDDAVRHVNFGIYVFDEVDPEPGDDR